MVHKDSVSELYLQFFIYDHGIVCEKKMLLFVARPAAKPTLKFRSLSYEELRSVRYGMHSVYVKVSPLLT